MNYHHHFCTINKKKDPPQNEEAGSTTKTIKWPQGALYITKKKPDLF